MFTLILRAKAWLIVSFITPARKFNADMPQPLPRRQPRRAPGSSLRRLVLVGVSSLLLVSLLPAGALAYEGDHYTWTYYLALQVGYTKRQALQIASGAYAIDWDPDTGPMEATPGDAIYGARHPGPISGNPHPQIATIWTKFHAFAETNYVGVGDEVEKARQRQKEALWALARAQRNPGPLIHFTQDYFSHFEFDNVRGHAVLGHKPDFISTDMNKAHRMTRDTVAVLQRFLSEVLGGRPKDPDWARVWEVLDRVAAADPTPNVLYPGNFNPYGGPGSPSFTKSRAVINQAVAEDEANGRLPRFPENMYNPVLPSKWYQYGFDAEGRVTDVLYPVEKPQFEVGKEQIEVTQIDDNNFMIKLRLSYKLSGLLDLRDGNGQSFLSPLPVYEKQELSDTVGLGRSSSIERGNGEYAVEIEVRRGRSELEKGITWNVTIHAHGFEPQTRQVSIPVPAETPAAQNCKALIAQAQQMLNAGDTEKAASLLAEAGQKCVGVQRSLTDLLDQTQKQLEQQVEQIENDAQQSINKCEYEEALRRAERLQQIDPNNAWLVNTLPQLQPQAEAQQKARQFLRPGLEAIQRKDLDGAIVSLRQAGGVAGVPQCLLDQINKLLRELERHKDFIKLTEQVEQATTRCDYKEASRIVGEITRIAPREQYVADWLGANLPKMAELQNRERKALALIGEAQAKANEANVAASTEPVDWNRVTSLINEAAAKLAEADKEAPKCMKERQRMEAIRQLLESIRRGKKSEIQTSIVLLIDTSGSMASNNKMEQAKEAAKRAARQAGKTTEIAVLNFDGGCDVGAVKIACGFTSDVNALVSAIDRLKPGDGTPMYISTGFAVDYAQKNARGKSRTVVLMSDGGDSCREKMAQAADAIRTSNIPVTTIGFDVGNNQQAQGDLRNISSITGGKSFSASAADPNEIINAFKLALLPSLFKDFDLSASGTPVQGYFSQAKMLIQQQDLNGATSQLQQAFQVAPESPAVNYNLALVYEANDKPLSAIKYAQNYLQLAPQALDRGDVESRISNLQKEVQQNPRAQYDPNSCRDIYNWAQIEKEAAKRDLARRQTILEILISSQRGDCENARRLRDSYKQSYR